MNRALGEAAVVAEAEVDDRLKRALGMAAAVVVEYPTRRALCEVAVA